MTGLRVRNIVERFLNRNKRFRRVTTCYDKLEDCYLVFVVASSIFVLIFTIDGPAPVLAQALASLPISEPERSCSSAREAPKARMSAQFFNGVTLELTCSGHDSAFGSAMIAALGAR